MKKIDILIVLFFTMSHGFSQQIHSPSEIFKIMADSKLSYELKLIEKEIPCQDNSEKLNYHDSYRILRDSGLETHHFNYTEEAKPLFDKAELFFNNHQTDSALIYYQRTIQVDSTLSNVMTYMGQIYEKREDRQQAIEWFKRAIQTNYIDYMAHWFLADNYLAINKIKDAANEIAIARILNRNNPRIKKSMDKIFEQAFMNVEDWCFNPQIQLSKTPDGKIGVSCNEKWSGYALTKALWKFEPGYKESMGVSDGAYSTLEDKECLITFLRVMENTKVDASKERQLMVLKEAVANKYLDSYILYEIVLPQTPFVAYQLPEKTILELKEYILNIRNN